MTTPDHNSTALRVSFTIAPDVLSKFNEMIPTGERSRVIQSLIQRALRDRGKHLEALAEEFDTHPDFRVARRDAAAFDVTAGDGLNG